WRVPSIVRSPARPPWALRWPPAFSRAAGSARCRSWSAPCWPSIRAARSGNASAGCPGRPRWPPR
ncbi:hypothetical protein MyNCGM683_53080, partial [Achromobacter xylosoxidans]